MGGSEATAWSGQEKPKSEQPNSNIFNTLCSHLPGLAPLFCDLPLRRGWGPREARSSRRAVGATGRERCVSSERAEGCQQEPARGPGPARAARAGAARAPHAEAAAGPALSRTRRFSGGGGPGGRELRSLRAPAHPAQPPRAGHTQRPAPASRGLGLGTGLTVTQGTAAQPAALQQRRVTH